MDVWNLEKLPKSFLGRYFWGVNLHIGLHLSVAAWNLTELGQLFWLCAATGGVSGRGSKGNPGTNVEGQTGRMHSRWKDGVIQCRCIALTKLLHCFCSNFSCLFHFSLFFCFSCFGIFVLFPDFLQLPGRDRWPLTQLCHFKRKLWTWCVYLLGIASPACCQPSFQHLVTHYHYSPLPDGTEVWNCLCRRCVSCQ